jgi:hypothetical protein
MKKHTRSILDELQSYLPSDNKDIIIENRANHILQSAINLMTQIEKNYSKEDAEELEKKFYSAIKNRDVKRFERVIKKIVDGGSE